MQESKQINSKCPVCNKQATVEHRPFCSKQCSYIDLGKWFNEEYTIANDDNEEYDSIPDEEYE